LGKPRDLPQLTRDWRKKESREISQQEKQEQREDWSEKSHLSLSSVTQGFEEFARERRKEDSVKIKGEKERNSGQKREGGGLTTSENSSLSSCKKGRNSGKKLARVVYKF